MSLISLHPVASCRLPTVDGDFLMEVWQGPDNLEIVALRMGTLSGPDPVFVRIHSQCFTSEVLGSLRCDCRMQFDLARRHIREEGSGLLIYLQQEGRGIGLANKVRAYALQDDGADTVEANHRLGFADDLRDFSAAGELLVRLGIQAVHLHTNNPDKLGAVERAGVTVASVIPSLTAPNEHNANYLYTKAHRMGHVALQELDFTPWKEAT